MRKLSFLVLMLFSCIAQGQVGRYETNPFVLANNAVVPLQVDASGNLKMNCITGCSGGGGGGSNAAAGTTGATVPTSAGYTGINVGGNLVGVSTSNPMPVSAASLPLPTGAATAANQTTANTSLSTIATNTPALGQATMSASTPVVISSNQSAIAVTNASLPLPTGASTSSLQPALNGDGGALSHVTNFPATQPVSIAAQPALVAGSALIGSVSVNDGTTTANNIAGDSGQNAQIITGGRKEVTYSITTVSATTPIDVSNYSCISIHTISTGTSSTATFQSSNDSTFTNWQNLPLTVDSIAPGFTAISVATISSNHIFTGALTGRYFRLNVTGISAGTTAGTIEFFSTCRPTFAVVTSATTLTSLVPTSSTQITAASGNVAAATATATLAAASGKSTYISGFEITSSGATVGTVVTCTVTGTITGTMSYTYAAPAGVLVMGTPLVVPFSPPIQSSATNTAIAVSCPSLGTGNTNTTVTAHGYQQ